MRLILALLCVIGIAACQRYSFSINEKTVYEPPPLFSAFKVADIALDKCLRENIAEQKARRAKDLTKLVCPAGAITSIDGLQLFSGLQQLGLKGNKISDISPLKGLSQLQQLDLSSNFIVDFGALTSLASLIYVNALENTDAHCASFPAQTNDRLEIDYPKHCKK